MKKITSSFLVALFAGAITLGAYKYFFENTKYAIVNDRPGASMFDTSLTPTSPKGSGLNDVDFTMAASTTVNAVVHVKNVTIGRTQPSSIIDFFYGHGGQGSTARPSGYRVGRNHFPRRVYSNEQPCHRQFESVTGDP